ncbi:MAG: hypothetical protein DMF06_05165 [Verrucomicrobia bacterium]|nr:MAG: hypothetical protein DMF06_05165 [Verrucomicrobiota bacterium]
MTTVSNRADAIDLGNGLRMALTTRNSTTTGYSVTLGRAYIGRALQFESDGRWRLFYREPNPQHPAATEAALPMCRDVASLTELAAFLTTGEGGF